MRYFFNIAGAVNKPDDKGMEFSTLSDARIHAVKFASDHILSIRTLALWFAVTFGVFALGCYLIYAWHAELSTSPVLTYSVVGVIGLATLVWPIFAVQLVTALARQFFRRGL